MRRLATFIYTVYLLCLPGIGFACAVCFSGKGASLDAYRLSTLFLTLFPLALFFGSFYWYYRKLKKKGDL